MTVDAQASVIRDAKPAPEGPMRMLSPLTKLAWREGGRQRLEVAAFFVWLLLEVVILAILMIVGVTANTLAAYAFPATAATFLALVWSSLATSSANVLRAALRDPRIDPRLRERWSLIVAYLDHYGSRGEPKGFFRLASAVTLTSAVMVAIGLLFSLFPAFASSVTVLSIPTLLWGAVNLAIGPWNQSFRAS